MHERNNVMEPIEEKVGVRARRSRKYDFEGLAVGESRVFEFAIRSVITNCAKSWARVRGNGQEFMCKQMGSNVVVLRLK